jgi:hypothetical protein
MTRDASLTEFGDGGDDDEEPTATGSESATGDDAAAPEPVRPTSRWSTNKQPCADCGARIQRTWTADGRLLCADCKEW